MMVESMLKILYLIAALFITLSSFALISSSFLSFLLYLVFGNIFGIVGMLVGVPIFALIYGYLSNQINNALKNKNLPTSNEEYINLERINTKNKKIVETEK